MEFNRFLGYYKNAPDLNVSDKEKKQHGRSERQRGVSDNRRGVSNNRSDSNQNFTRFFINVGRRDGVMPEGLIGKINGIPGVGRIKIGKIEIMRNTSLLEADSKFIPQILGAFARSKINGKDVTWISEFRDFTSTLLIFFKLSY